MGIRSIERRLAPELCYEAVAEAVHAYVASYLAGRDVLLMAADWARCRELAARIRDALRGNGVTVEPFG